MRILELTDYSAGICGVWARAKEESIRFAKLGHDVKVFSSNFTKGSDLIAPSKEKISGVDIKRFPALVPGKKPLHFLPGGESYIFWNYINFKKELKEFSPQIIICHSYRHPHTLYALRLARTIGAKIILVTHAPFVEKDSTRSFWGHAARWFFDFFIGGPTLKKFDKIVAITNWEIPYLTALGVKKDKIVYIPNGIPEDFFASKSVKGKEVLFFGRVSPIKNLEVLVHAAKKVPKINFNIVGPIEEDYKKEFYNLISQAKNVKYFPPIFNIKEKIRVFDSCNLFILPSWREAMPQVLLEAMSRKKLVISSKTNGGMEIIENGKDGLLFEINNSEQLADLIKKNYSADTSEIRKAALSKAKKFQWKNLIAKYLEIFND